MFVLVGVLENYCVVVVVWYYCGLFFGVYFGCGRICDF